MAILLASLGYFCNAIVAILDKFILSEAKQTPIVYTFYSAVISLLGMCMLPFGVVALQGVDVLVSVLAGVAFAAGLFAFFHAVEESEISHIGPFSGALLTVFVFIFSALFLGERLSLQQTAGVSILAAASLLLSFEKSKQHRGVHRGFLWAAAAALCFSVLQIASKYLYVRYPFLTVLVWNSIFVGLAGASCLFFQEVRQAVFGKKKTARAKKNKRTALIIIAVDKTLAFASVLLVQYAVSQGSVIIVNALSGLQFVFMFLLVLFLTRFAPRVFSEYMTKAEIAVQTTALALAAVGLALLV